MSENVKPGDDHRLAPMDDSLPPAPGHATEPDQADQVEPEEVDYALLDQ